jgi:hypothetical protein
MRGRSSVTDIRIVHVFVFPYTMYFHIVERSTGDSKQDRYSHRIAMHVVTSDYTCLITKGDTLPVLTPRCGMVRVVRVDSKIP